MPLSRNSLTLWFSWMGGNRATVARMSVHSLFGSVESRSTSAVMSSSPRVKKATCSAPAWKSRSLADDRLYC